MGGEISRAVAAQHLGQAHRGAGGKHVRPSALGRIEQFQRRSGAGQVAARQMHVAHGRRDVTVAKESLHGRQVHAGFDQVGSESVPPMPMSA